MVEFYDGENFLAGLDDDDDDDIYNDEVYVCLSVCLSRFCLFCLTPAKLTIYI